MVQWRCSRSTSTNLHTLFRSTVAASLSWHVQSKTQGQFPLRKQRPKGHFSCTISRSILNLILWQKSSNWFEILKKYRGAPLVAARSARAHVSLPTAPPPTLCAHCCSLSKFLNLSGDLGTAFAYFRPNQATLEHTTQNWVAVALYVLICKFIHYKCIFFQKVWNSSTTPSILP